MIQSIKSKLNFYFDASWSASVLREALRMEKRFIGVKELAIYLDVSEGTIYDWVCYKKIPFTKVGRLDRFEKSKIDSWLLEKTVEAVR